MSWEVGPDDKVGSLSTLPSLLRIIFPEVSFCIHMEKHLFDIVSIPDLAVRYDYSFRKLKN